MAAGCSGDAPDSVGYWRGLSIGRGRMLHPSRRYYELRGPRTSTGQQSGSSISIRRNAQQQEQPLAYGRLALDARYQAMPPRREVKTCDRCRLLKIRCDRASPCQHCTRSDADCSLLPAATYDEASPDSGNSSTIPSTGSRLTDQSKASTPSSKHASDSPAGPDITRKRRRRACLSCVRCHRLKVKCDKKQPCTRCRLSGWAKHCTYTHRIEDETAASAASESASPFVKADEDPEAVVATWHSRHRGLSHWKALLSRLNTLSGIENAVFLTASKEVIQRHDECAAGRALPGNFPFNSPGAVKYTSLDRVRELVESHRARHREYIDSYLELYQCIHPIIDTLQFLTQVVKFWDDPTSTSVAWLAEFLMVLSLGCFSVRRDPEPTVELCMAAEACLSKTPFMIRPNISTMRTLCLVVVTKQVVNGTCWSFDSCWSLLGVIVRLAVCLGIHRPQPPPDSLPVVFRDWESSQILWTTILYFNIQMAMTTGMPSCLSSEEMLQDHGTLSWSFATLDTPASAWHAVIHTSYPVILRVIARVNSDVDKPSYEEILEYSARVRELKSVMDRVQGHNTTLRIALDVFFRRVILVLHRRHALEPDAPSRYPVSYWSSLECSLALLVHHRDLCDKDRRVMGLDLMGDLYMLDFFAAALTASTHLLRKDAPLAVGFAIWPRRTILDTLEACSEIWAEKEYRSLCFHSGHRLLKAVVGVLSGMYGGQSDS